MRNARSHGIKPIPIPLDVYQELDAAAYAVLELPGVIRRSRKRGPWDVVIASAGKPWYEYDRDPEEPYGAVELQRVRVIERTIGRDENRRGFLSIIHQFIVPVSVSEIEANRVPVGDKLLQFHEPLTDNVVTRHIKLAFLPKSVVGVIQVRNANEEPYTDGVTGATDEHWRQLEEFWFDQSTYEEDYRYSPATPTDVVNATADILAFTESERALSIARMKL